MKSMKFTRIVIGIFLIFFTMNFTNKKSFENKPHFTYCHAENFDDQILYVSNVFECNLSTDESTHREIKKRLRAEWTKVVNTKGVEGNDPIAVSRFLPRESSIESSRKDYIAFKEELGMKIVYINDFSFDCD